MRTPAKTLVCALGWCLVVVVAAGCHNGRGPDDPADFLNALPAVNIGEGEFASAVHRVMRDGEQSAERSSLLAGVVRAQLRHAAALFRRGESERGANAVVGAMLLVRAGEARKDMVDAEGLFALSRAFERFSALGDEGRALALITLQRRSMGADPARHAELAEHEQALSTWLRDIEPGTRMERLGARQRRAAGQSMLDPSRESLAAAQGAVDDWVARAVEINLDHQRTHRTPSRAVLIEAYGALQLGGETMAAVFLRHGKAAEAFAVLEAGAAGRVVDGGFMLRLQATAEQDTAEEWRLLAATFRQRVLDDEEVKMPDMLVGAALWGIALEAYRRDPTSFAIDHTLSNQLRLNGMPEVAPLVLADALGVDPTAVSLSGVLRVIEESLEERGSLGDAGTARRIFLAAEPVLAIADRARFRAHASPSAATVRRLMCDIELHDGNADRARPLLARALDLAPTLAGHLRLAHLERQAGRGSEALAQLARGLDLDDGERFPLEVAEAHLLAFAILLERDDREHAAERLSSALTMLLSSRETGDITHRAHAELLLARVLVGFGDGDGAKRALERAAEMASSDQLQGEVVLAMMTQAVTQRDLTLARRAVQLGLKSTLEGPVMVRAALWLMSLETELGERPDGKVERALGDVPAGADFWAVVPRWARQLDGDAALNQAATTHAERMQAAFYVALRRRAEGAPNEQTTSVWREVAADAMYWEPEVKLARAWLAPRVTVPLPADVALP